MQDFEPLFLYIEQHIGHSGGLRPPATGCWLVLPRSGARAKRCAFLHANFAFFSRAHIYVLFLLLLYICAAVRAVVRVAFRVVRCVVTMPQSLCSRAFRCVVGCVVGCAVGCVVGCVVVCSMSAASDRLWRQTPTAHDGKARRAATGKPRGAAVAGGCRLCRAAMCLTGQSWRIGDGEHGANRQAGAHPGGWAVRAQGRRHGGTRPGAEGARGRCALDAGAAPRARTDQTHGGEHEKPHAHAHSRRQDDRAPRQALRRTALPAYRPPAPPKPNAPPPPPRANGLPDGGGSAALV